MAIERIDSLFALPEIQQEFAAVKAGLADSQKGLVDLYNLIKGFKDTNISNLAANSEKLAQAINGSVQATANAAKNYEALTQKIAQQTSAIRDNLSVVAGTNQAYDQLIKQSVRNKLAQDELAKSAKEVKAAFDKGETTFEQYTASLESIKGAQQQLKISNQDITKGLNNLEKQAQSSGTSIDGLKAKLNLLTQAYDKLSEEERASEGGQSLLKNLNETDAAYKKLKEDSGRFQDSVGNYKGAFQDAFKVLKDELTRVNKQMSDLETKGSSVVQNLTGGNKLGFDPNRHKGDITSFTKAGGETTNIVAGDAGAYAQLTQRQELLNKLVTNTSIGFKSSRQELRAFQEAAVELGMQVGQTDEKFLLFNEAVGETKNAIQDIKAATAFQAQDAKVIVGLTSAVNGLVGAYGAASAAVSLLGADDEDAQKQMAKFQQLLVLINGLQQVSNTLQTESGAVQLALAAKTALLSAATKIQTLVVGEATKVIIAEADANMTLAESQAAIVETAATAIASNEAVGVAAGEATVGLEAETVAATEAAAATTGFATALIATGIGVVIVAIGAAVAYLIVKIGEWTASTDLNVKQQKELNDALASQIETLQKINDLQDTAGKKSIETLQHQLELEEKSGQNQYAIFAIKEKIAAKNAEIADTKYAQVVADAENKYVKEGLTGIEALHRAQNDYFEDLTEKTYKVSVVQKELDNALALSDQQRKKQGFSDKEMDRLKDRLAAAQAEKNVAQSNFDFYNKGEKDRTDAQNQQENLRVERAKFSADEERKLVLETAKLEVDAQKDKNSKILSDQASTLQERLQAIRSNAQQEKKAAQAEFTSIRNDPSTTPTQLVDARRKLNAAFAQADRDAAKETQDTNRTYYERDRDAALAIYKDEQEQKIRIAQDLQQGKANNPNPFQPNEVPLSKRLKGLSDEYSARKNMLNAELKVELDKEGQTEEEKLAIYAKYGNDIDLLNRDFQKSYLEMEKEAQELSLRQWEMYYSKRRNQIDSEADDAIKGLNQKNIGDKEYARQRQKIEDEAAVKKAQIAVQDAEVQRNATKDGTQARIDADAKLAQSALELSDKIKKAKEDGENATKDRVKEGVDEIEMLGDAAVTVLDIGYNTQKVHLEELEARQQRAYEQQVKNIDDSTATEEQKAIRLRILDDQRAAQKEANDRKQRQLDIQKAQFDKANAIMHIILNTAVAVMQAGANIPLAVAIGLEGAAQLAAAIATPLPHYKEGTLNHPGGEAVTGDGGAKELILEPGRPARWSKDRPTIEKLMPHTKVIPPHKIEEWLMAGMFVNQQGALVDTRQPDIKQELRDIKDAIVWAAREQRELSKANRPRIINKVTVNAGWHTYIENSVLK